MSGPTGEFGGETDVRRAVTRITSQTLLRGMEVIAFGHDNDLIQGMVFTAIWVANVEPLTHEPEQNLKFSELDAIPPDELRRPVSVFAISASLKIPYETTRRYANRLVEKGLCVRVGRQGLIVPARVFRQPNMLRSTEMAYDTLQALLTDLRGIGFLK